VRSVEYRTGLFVWGLEVVGGVCVCVCSRGSWWRFRLLGVVCFL